MLKLKILGSGSSGNCYLLSTENETLILDAGLPIKEIKKGLEFDLSKVVGCVVTHSHKDHNLSVDDLKSMGIRVWQPYEKEIEHKRVQRRYFGRFMIRSFELPHDNEPCVGYIIVCPNGDNVLYATDYEYIKYSFKAMKINHLLIEANYQKELVDTGAENRNHVLRGHAELQTTLGVIKDNLSNALQTVILCHLSRENANPKEMLAEVKKVANCEVYVAEKGIEIELKNGNECPF